MFGSIFGVNFWGHFSGHFSGTFAGNGFSDLIREIYCGKLAYGVGKPISGKFICRKWGRETLFGPIHPHKGSSAGVYVELGGEVRRSRTF